MIHRTTDSDGTPVYSISAQRVWRPGCFDSERAARYGQRFPDEVLRRLQDSVSPGLITFAMLQAEQARLAAPQG